MFVKLFNQILDSSIADNRPLRHFFTDLLLCCDPQGFVVMTEAAIARRIGATLEEVRWGLAELEKPDPRSKTPDNDGRRIERLEGSGYGWRVLNFESYKLMKSAEDMREKTRERVRRFRDKTKDSGECNADVTPCNAGNACNTTKRKRKRKTNTKNKDEDEERREESPPPDFEKPAQEKINPKRMATHEQIVKFAKSQPMPISDECCDAFFDRMEAEGWITPRGFPLADWQPRFRSWVTSWANNAAGRKS